MKLEAILLFSATIISVLSLIFVPKKKAFQAQFIFLSLSLPVWILGLTAVQLGLLEYPYRELSTTNRTSFIFEYLILPIIAIHFNVRFPERSTKIVKIIYYVGITLGFTVIEYFLEKYTLIITYTGWKLHWTFISICFIFWLSRKVTYWFFKGI
jgi:hypothetical protein